MTRIAYAVIVLLFLMLIIAPSPHAAPADNATERELVVGTKVAPPFAMQDADGTWHGIAIDLWRRIADQLHLRYRFEPASLQELIDHTGDRHLDAAVAALTVTADRERRVDFTEPYYSTGLGIAVPSAKAMTWWPIVASIFSIGFVRALAGLVGVALTVGLLVWFFERRHNEHFSGPATKGIGSSVWWSALTMTQSGGASGDRVPITLPGRVVAIVWMTASVIVIASFTAALTTQLTTRTLLGLVHSEADLRSVRVGAVGGSETVSYLDHERIEHREFPDVMAGLRALRSGNIDAFVYDRPLLAWAIRQNFPGTLEVLNVTFDPQVYAIALPQDSSLRSALNLSLLSVVESDWWRQTLFRYLGSN